jgi:hypothetical protein
VAGPLAGIPLDTNGATRVRLKGTTRIEAHTGRSSGELALGGIVVDDAGKPAATRVGIRLTRGDGAGSLVGGHFVADDLPLETLLPESCISRAPVSGLVLESATRLVVPTDDSGRFCVRLLLARDRYVAHLAALPTDLLEESRLDVPIDGRVKPVVLTMSLPAATAAATPWAVALDEDAVAVDVAAATDADGVATPVGGVTVDLTNEAGVRLGEATTDASGRAHFVVPTDRVGAMGRGELRASFAGDAELGPGASAVPIERRTHVRLLVPSAVGGVLPAAASGTTFGLRVVAEPQCAKRGCKSAPAIPTGVVEARAGDAIVGAGTLEGGVTRVPILLEVPHAASVALSLRYIGDAPWFLTSDDTEVMQPVREPMPWGKLATALAGAMVLAWFLGTRAPFRAAAVRAPARGGTRPRPVAGVHLVEALPDVPRWRGCVVDAHDGAPIPGAEIAIEQAGFDGVRVLCRTTADARGAFTLSLTDTGAEAAANPPAPGAQELARGSSLVAESSLHASVRRPTPAFGTVEIALVLRRRALLDRLVAWARARGGALNTSAEPTPAQVRSAAGDERVARWAAATERAAFGWEPVDAATQSAVDRLAPPDATGGSDAGGESVTGESPSRPR